MPTWPILLMLLLAETFFQVLFLHRNLGHSVNKPEGAWLNAAHGINVQAELSQQGNAKNIRDVNENCSLLAFSSRDRLLVFSVQRIHISLFAKFVPRGQGARTNEETNFPD